MLPKGSIAKIYEYYFSSPDHKEDIFRALREFFGSPDSKRGSSLKMTALSKGLFNEWFLYDFILSNGTTTMADFIARNPLNINDDEMRLYVGILETNDYGIFEVLKIDVGHGLMIRNLQAGGELYVQERKLTTQAKPGDIFFGRTGKVGDHLELIGADTFSFGGVDERFKETIRKIKEKLTPKFAQRILEARPFG